MLRVIVGFTTFLTITTLSVALFMPVERRATAMGYQAVGVLLCYYSVRAAGVFGYCESYFLLD